MKTLKFIPCCVVMTLVAVGLPAQPKDKPDKDNKKAAAPAETSTKEVKEKEPWIKVDVVITPQEREVIQTYVKGKTKGKAAWKKSKQLPPGLSKKLEHGGKLPPGWQKKLVPGNILPVEVFEQCHPLPSEVVIQLPPPPSDTILVAVSGKVVRLIKATHEILDVFNVKF